jgi:CubicO group peptidase (beta-lactamase class C family)
VTESLPRSTPAEAGVPAAAIEAFENALGSLDRIDSYILLKGGSVIGERWWAPEGPQKPHVMWSVSKSFASTAIGMLIDAGSLTLDTRIVDLFADVVPAQQGEWLSQLAVRHLLTMTTGHDAESLPTEDRENDVDWVDHILGQSLVYEPGTHFQYNSGATYLLSAIVQRLTGGTLLDYLEPRLFAPLGIRSPTWELSPQGISVGGWGLNLRTEDLAKFGQLYLQRGAWNGAQVVPREWTFAATSWQVPNGDPTEASDWSQGYGYQFWVCRHNAFRGDGKDGQFIIVLPEQDAVVAITAQLVDMQEELDEVWRHLLPALG